jgi:hypothetical protein
MNANDIQMLLGKLGSTKIHTSGQWVYSSCPLAPYTHKKGFDAHPSFTVAVDTNGISGAKCHACNFSGSLMELMYKFQRASSRPCNDLIAFVEKNNGPTFINLVESIRRKHEAEDSYAAARRAHRENPEAVAPPPPPKAWDPDKEVAGITGVQMDLQMKLGDRELLILPEETFNRWQHPTDEVLDYLTGTGDSPYGKRRNLSAEMLKLWEIRWDSHTGRVIIPVRDCKQRLVGHSGRAFSPQMKPKYMHAKGFRRDFYVYGEHLWKGSGTCCLVEGFFDVHRLVSYGYQAGAVMGSALSEFQLEKIVRNFDRVLVFPDGDQPGYVAGRKWYEQVSVRLPATVVPTPEMMDPDDFSRDEARMFLGDP